MKAEAEDNGKAIGAAREEGVDAARQWLEVRGPKPKNPYNGKDLTALCRESWRRGFSSEVGRQDRWFGVNSLLGYFEARYHWDGALWRCRSAHSDLWPPDRDVGRDEWQLHSVQVEGRVYVTDYGPVSYSHPQGDAKGEWY